MIEKNCAGWRPRKRRPLSCCALAILGGLVSILALTSCATGTRPIPVSNLPPPPPPKIESNLRQACPEPPLLQSAGPVAILSQHDQEAVLHRDCRKAKASLDAAVNEWEATAWRWYCQAVSAIGAGAKGCPRD